MTDIIYSGSPVPDKGNRKQKNPKYFTTLPAGVTRVILDADVKAGRDPAYDRIRAAAAAAKVEVVTYEPGMFSTKRSEAKKEGE